MGIRRNILVQIKDTINGLVVGNDTLKAENTFFDPISEESQLPKFSVVPEPEEIDVGLFGQNKDRFLRIGLYGFSKVDAETLFLDGEDIIEEVTKTLTSSANVDAFKTTGFSITRMSQIVAEQYAREDYLVYLSIVLHVEFLDDPP